LFAFCNQANANEKGEEIYKTCAACHGSVAEGNESLNAPALAGQFDWYLTKQINNLKSGIRGSHKDDTLAKQMAPFLAQLTATDIQNLSSYLTKLESPKVTASAAGDMKNGFRYYQGKCGACHGNNAEGNKSFKAPKLAGLSVSYLKRQMNNFVNGVRGNHKDDKLGRQMAMMARMTSGQELDDILLYIESQGN